MSNDLISRSALLEKFDRSYDTIHMFEVADLIDNAPTAYDVDKVLEKLVKLNNQVAEYAEESEREGDGWDESVFSEAWGAYNEAINIVKEGWNNGN